MGQMSEPARGLYEKIVKGIRNNIYMFSSLYVSYFTSNKIYEKRLFDLPSYTVLQKCVPGKKLLNHIYVVNVL